MKYTEASEEALATIEEHLSVVAAGHPIEKHGSLFEELCVAFQGRAIFFLLNDLNIDHYGFNLVRSLQARKFYLRKLREQNGKDEVFSALSRTNCIFAAIAIDERDSILQIEQLSAQTWMRDGEYEENYAYHKSILAILAGDNDNASSYCDAMESALEGADDNRHLLCRAFLNRDEETFWFVFDDFLDERLQRDTINHDDGRVYSDPWLMAFQYLSLEAVAWLKLAGQGGFTASKGGYRMCPSVALRQISVSPFPNVFLEMEKEFNL